MSPHGFIYLVYRFIQVLGSTDFILHALRSQLPPRFGPPLGHQACTPEELLNWPAELLPLDALDGPPDLAPDRPTSFGPLQMDHQLDHQSDQQACS